MRCEKLSDCKWYHHEIKGNDLTTEKGAEKYNFYVDNCIRGPNPETGCVKYYNGNPSGVNSVNVVVINKGARRNGSGRRKIKW